MAKTQVKLQQIQRQALSPLQKLSGELLELPSEALEERIEKEIQDNPYLEEEESEYSKHYFYSSNDKINVRNFTDNDQIGLNTPTTITLAEDLINQLQLSNISQEEYKIGEFLIGNLDDRGYLTRSLSAIVDDIYFETYKEVDIASLEKVLKVIQNFEPAGIAARNHQECLILQLQRLDNNNPKISLSKQIITKYWTEFCKKDFQKLQQNLCCSQQDLENSFKLIQGLNISPGYIEASQEKEQYIIPDVTIWNDNGKIKYKLNKISDRKLQINKEGQRLLEKLENTQQKDKETIKFLKDKIESAKLFIEAYNNRMQTLNTFVQEIIAYQEEYFQEGDVMSLRPMKYEDIKQRTGFSESTLSRLANDKYMQTHFGTFKIRKLFTKSIENQSGESVSSDSVRNIIIELIQNEDPLLPLKDQEIENILNAKGFSLSRRTITKYRQQLGIETAGKRKKQTNEQ